MGAVTLRCLVLLGVAMTLTAQEKATTIHEESLVFPTWDEGLPSPDPDFSGFSSAWFPNYPYTIHNPVNRVRESKTWRVVILENGLLSCRIMPDLGGHLQGCTDLSTSREIFYSNPAIRRTAENPRGTFIATGIESSFPEAPGRLDSSPVDYASTVDGGVGRVVVGATDLTSGMEWRVEFILRPGSAVLEQHATLYNGTTARHGYHWWVNAAIELDDPGLEFIYPTRWMLPHGDGPMSPWPLGPTGVDLSQIANYKDRAGWFAHGSHEPWMAIYKPRFRDGVAHYADASLVKGKKLWLWGSTDTYVRGNLTNAFNSYVEMQAGELETQPEFSFLQPGESKTFTHYWIPFHDLDGLSRVTPDAAMNLSRKGPSITVAIDPMHAMHGWKLRVSSDTSILSETTLDQAPRTNYSKTIETAPTKVTVDLLNASGAVVMHHVEGELNALPYDGNAPNPEPVEPKDHSDSEAASLALGDYHERLDSLSLAWRDYTTGLKKTPESEKLRLAAGRVAISLHRDHDALQLLNGLAGAEASYYFGVAGESDRPADAAAAFARTTGDPVWSTPAKRELAFMALREADKSANTQGLKLLQELAAIPGAPVDLGALEVAALRRSGSTGDAKKRLEYWLQQDPANDTLRVERSMLGYPEDQSLWDHLGADPERVVGVAEQYRMLGAWDDALKVLDRHYPIAPETQKEIGTVAPQDNPLVVYYRGYCRLKLGQDPAADFKAASELSTLYIFPHRAIYFRIFQTALLKNIADPTAHALLGDLYFDSLMTDDAIAEWTKALALREDLPALHRNLGLALLWVRNDRVGALRVLTEGRKLDPSDHDILYALHTLGIN